MVRILTSLAFPIWKLEEPGNASHTAGMAALPSPGELPEAPGTSDPERSYLSRAKAARPRGASQVRLQRVVRDPQLAARTALVVVAPLEDQPRVAAGPVAQRIAAADRGQDDVLVAAEQRGRQVVHLQTIRSSQCHGPLDHPLELA